MRSDCRLQDGNSLLYRKLNFDMIADSVWFIVFWLVEVQWNPSAFLFSNIHSTIKQIDLVKVAHFHAKSASVKFGNHWWSFLWYGSILPVIFIKRLSPRKGESSNPTFFLLRDFRHFHGKFDDYIAFLLLGMKFKRSVAKSKGGGHSLDFQCLNEVSSWPLLLFPDISPPFSPLSFFNVHHNFQILILVPR